MLTSCITARRRREVRRNAPRDHFRHTRAGARRPPRPPSARTFEGSGGGASGPGLAYRCGDESHLSRSKGATSMGRVALMVSVALALLFAVAGPSSAFQCPKLIKQVNDEAGNRLDDAGFSARQLAEDAEALHKAGKPAEGEAKAKEAMKQLGSYGLGTWGASEGPPSE